MSAEWGPGLAAFGAGLVALVAGGDLLVRGASRLAARFGVPPLVVGLTVVAFGTSAPELAVSVASTLEGRADLAVGNVVGSNVFNVLFILGLSALITPLVVASQLVRIEVPLMIAASLAVPLLGLDGRFGRVDGLVLFAGGLVYTWQTVRRSRGEAAGTSEPARAAGSGAVDGLLVLGGLALLVVGSRWLVAAAVAAARALGVSELIVGLTIVAAGTSLPEVAASVVAALRGERDIAVGNVVGSNLFNILVVLGLSATVAPAGVPVASAALRLDIPVMVAVAFACLPIFRSGGHIDRWEGGLFLAYYAAYTATLIYGATARGGLPAFSGIMLGFVVPLTVLTLVLMARDPSR